MDHQTGPVGASSADDGETAVPDRPTAELIAGRASATALGDATAAAATGDPRVDAALKLLDQLPRLPLSEHPDVFEQVHAQLSDVLGELDPGSAGTGG